MESINGITLYFYEVSKVTAPNRVASDQVRRASVDKLLSKVPEVTLAFWIIKILATTLGETGGDTVSMTKIAQVERSTTRLSHLTRHADLALDAGQKNLSDGSARADLTRRHEIFQAVAHGGRKAKARCRDAAGQLL